MASSRTIEIGIAGVVSRPTSIGWDGTFKTQMYQVEFVDKDVDYTHRIGIADGANCVPVILPSWSTDIAHGEHVRSGPIVMQQKTQQKLLLLKVLFLRWVANRGHTQNADALLGVIRACFRKSQERSRATRTAPNA